MTAAEFVFVDRAWDFSAWLRPQMLDLKDVKRWLAWKFTRDEDGVPVASVQMDASKREWPTPQRVFAGNGMPPTSHPDIAPLWHESSHDAASKKATAHAAALSKMEDSLSKPLNSHGGVSGQTLERFGYEAGDAGRLAALMEVRAYKACAPTTVAPGSAVPRTLRDDPAFASWPPPPVARLIRLSEGAATAAAAAAAAATVVNTQPPQQRVLPSTFSTGATQRASAASSASPSVGAAASTAASGELMPDQHGAWEAASAGIVLRVNRQCLAGGDVVLVRQPEPPFAWLAQVCTS